MANQSHMHTHNHDNRTTAEGQLRPLSKRLSPHQQEKRAVKIEARRTVAEQISREHAITRGAVGGILQLLNRGFFGRLKWILFGK